MILRVQEKLSNAKCLAEFQMKDWERKCCFFFSLFFFGFYTLSSLTGPPEILINKINYFGYQVSKVRGKKVDDRVHEER